MNAEDPQRLNDEIDPDALSPEDSVESEQPEQTDQSAPAAEPESAPLSAAPPRILAETPIGGVPHPVRSPLHALTPEPAEDESSAEPEVEPAPAALDQEPAESAAEPELDAESDAESELVAESEPDAAPAVAEPADTSAPEVMALPRRTPAPPADEDAAESAEWDEDLSPELAAVLFTPRSAPERAEEPPAASAQAERPSVSGAIVPAQARAMPEAEAEPITLTDRADALHLPITAQERAAPAPEAPLGGKVRYVRVEEPFGKDGGQRISETWRYYSGDLPALGDREVRGARREEIRYADGSWRWRYERRYDGGGRDRREVRANADNTVFERADEVARRDPETGKREQFRERVTLIFAPPPHEEKRGLLSSLIGRVTGGDDVQKKATWREAAPAEARRAHREGGKAFGRSVLEMLFGG